MAFPEDFTILDATEVTGLIALLAVLDTVLVTELATDLTDLPTEDTAFLMDPKNPIARKQRLYYGDDTFYLASFSNSSLHFLVSDTKKSRYLSSLLLVSLSNRLGS